MTTQHSTPRLPVCASLPGQIEPHHLRIVLTSLPTLSTLPPRVALAGNLAGQFYKNVRWQMGASSLERDHSEVVESGIELQVIGQELEPHDIAEAHELEMAHALLAEAIQKRDWGKVRHALRLINSLRRRDRIENAEYHQPIRAIGRTVAGYHDRVGLKRLINCSNPDAA